MTLDPIFGVYMYYYSFNSYLRERYGCKVRRISLDAGFSCPNKDDTAGTGGCIYCNDLAFSPFAGKTLTLDEQIGLSLKGTKKGSKAEKFIAYFQNATNTYASCDKLKAAYDVIKKYPEIAGLFISTRPDCIDDDKLDLIASYMPAYEVWIEYGLQTVHDRTLRFIGRGHDHKASVEAIKKTAEWGIKVGVHVILGLPGETGDDMIATAREVSALPVSGIKLHVLHVLKGTPLEKMYNDGKIKLMERDEYVRAACDLLENIREDIVVFRLVSDASREVLIAPGWINNKPEVINLIESELERRGTRQGNKITGE